MEVTISQLGFILFPGLGNLAVPSSGNHFVIFPFKAKKRGLREKQTRKVEKGIGAIITRKETIDLGRFWLPPLCVRTISHIRTH